MESRGSQLSFPQEGAERSEDGGPAGSAARGKRPPTILLVEDEPLIRDLFQIVLRRRGWRVVVAGNGQEAMTGWQRGGIDLVLMDIRMPEMDGIAATRLIRTREKEGEKRVPIIALTAHARPQDREECLAAGMDGWLTKPIAMERLCQAVAEQLEGYGRQETRK